MSDQSVSTPATPAREVFRPEMAPLTLHLAVAAFLMAAHNATFWGHAWRLLGDRPVMLALLGGAFAALTVLTTFLVGIRRLRKAGLIFLILVGASASYYADRLGIVIDRAMIQNMMLTTGNEARHLITASMAWHLVLWGLVPAALVLWVRVAERPVWPALWRWALAVVFWTAMVLALLFPGYQTFAAIFREHRELAESYLPGAPISAAVRYAKMVIKDATAGPVQPLGLDARRGAVIAAAPRPVVTLLVVGETARAQNFGLNAAEFPAVRNTTPELAARGVLNFPNATSCGTSTAVSVPCMFHPETRATFGDWLRRGRENLLDVLSHAGIAVEWWDNNTGSQFLGARIAERRMGPADDPAACAAGECTDAVFLEPLAQALAGIDRDTVLVLHLIGSHGPAYFLRYPPEFARFQPDCRAVEFGDCTAAEVANAYDNSMLYTDHVLGRIIDLLAAQHEVIPALVYLSDHGESLGEGGMFLHGAPWFMAPEVQTRVPMVAWLPEVFTRAMSLDRACLARAAAGEVSHDNFFHSVLGLMNIETGVRDAGLDLFGPCRSVP